MGSSVRPAPRTQSLARCSYTLVNNVISVFALYPSHRLLCGLDCLDAEIVVTAFLLWKTYCPCCPFGPSRSHVRHSALMTRTMFVSEGCPRLLRSCTVTKPRTRLTHCVLSGGPANAALAANTMCLHLVTNYAQHRQFARGEVRSELRWQWSRCSKSGACAQWSVADQVSAEALCRCGLGEAQQ